MSEKKEFSYQLKPVCSSKAMQLIVENALNTTGEAYVKNWVAVACDEKKLKAVASAIFVDDFSAADAAEGIDLEKVQEGIQDFLGRSLIGSKKLRGLMGKPQANKN